ncbi:Similar to Ece1: Endothelin-converting enzyme 1 (Mus musculus) [Cotesia congregata]|uniref:Similar to Ece1: Endothelin-converting enzyme 1 (Mus musculus) n=1 Tax=Cotesia congregata TaxID=51543 RepID=A0A8J2HFF8_COTCN|nr:Similar to Ece1: Endothelin-converting enzyme 1 (Mus musculus) [Cotesia congregata]
MVFCDGCYAWYHSTCVNVKNQRKTWFCPEYKGSNDIRFLQRLIVELGNWPVLRGDRWNEKNFYWLTLIKPPFFEFSNHESINQSDPQIKAYYDYMVNISVLLGADEPIAESELSDSLEFELELTSISNNLLIDSLLNNTALIEEMSVADMIERWPSVNWIKFFKMATQPFYEINNATIIRTAGSFIYLDNLIQILNYTPKRIQANFGLWNIIERLVPFLIDTLSSVDWIDEETKKNAIAKAEAIKSLIAYPDELLDDEMLEEYFADLDLDNDCFLKNSVQLKRFNWIKEMENISKSFNIYYRANWNVTSFDLIKSRAHYIPTLNSFAMTTGLLQGLIFGIHRPNYMNYGATGTIIGHEVSHAFDPFRFQYDHIGRVNNLWTDKSYNAYQDRARCFIYQYNNYTLDASEQKLNGTRTLAENIADNVGIRIAYLAYQDWVVRNGPEPSLLELSSYTSNQLF